jgi:hypothetical protein
MVIILEEVMGTIYECQKCKSEDSIDYRISSDKENGLQQYEPKIIKKDFYS